VATRAACCRLSRWTGRSCSNQSPQPPWLIKHGLQLSCCWGASAAAVWAPKMFFLVWDQAVEAILAEYQCQLAVCGYCSGPVPCCDVSFWLCLLPAAMYFWRPAAAATAGATRHVACSTSSLLAGTQHHLHVLRPVVQADTVLSAAPARESVSCSCCCGS
jgi:hypothetical protein